MKSEATAIKAFEPSEPTRVVDEALLVSIMDKAKSIRLELGDTLAGDYQAYFYVLASGGIRLLKASKSGEQSTIAVLTQRGQCFGSYILLPAEKTQETARATDNTTVLQFERPLIESLCKSRSGFHELLWQWELLRRSIDSLKETSVWSKADSRALLKMLHSGELISLAAGQVHQVVNSGAPSAIILCAGDADISVNQKKTTLFAGVPVKLPEAESSAVVLQASDSCIVFTGPLVYINELTEHSNEDQSVDASLYILETQQEAVAQDISKGDRPPAEWQKDFPLGTISWVKKRFRQYPLILQLSAMDCGIACLAMVAAYHGQTVSINRLRELARVTNQGTDLKTLADAGETIGFLARGVKANYQGLLRMNLPLICHWGSNHYVVLYELSDDGALIADPADDIVSLKRDQFLERYSGYALELTPTAKLAAIEKTTPSLGRYTALLKEHKKALADIAIASVLIQLLMLATPFFTQVIIDKVLIHQSLSMLNILLLGMILLSLFQTTISALRTYFMAFTGMKLDQTLFVQFYKHVLSLPLSFFEERTQGDIMTRFAENRKIRELMSGSTLATLIDVVMAFAYLLIIYIYNLSFGIFTTAYIGIFAIIAFAVAPTLRNLRRRCFQKDVAANSYLLESVRGIEKIKSAATENRTRWAWELRFVDALNTNFKGTLVARATQLVCELVHLSGNILLLWFGANLVIQETLSIGQLMAMNLMVARISEPILHVVDVWDELQDVTVSLERLNDVLDQTPEETQTQSKFVLPGVSGKIRFDAVTFRYSGNTSKNALQNVSFTIEPGQMIGIAGRSGCGKSTLLKLIQGLYPPTNGRVFLDDHDLSHVALASLRTKVGVVAQHEYMFRGSIREAISYYDPEASAQQVIDAAKLAGIHDFICTLPRGYDYELTEGGSNLSGGQRQRLAIARAIVHDPKILIFDEATSFLDSESEKAIQSSLAKLRGNRTMIVVAHRLSTIRDADTILVMDRGQIVETGNHASLIAQKGLYYYLSQQQTID